LKPPLVFHCSGHLQDNRFPDTKIRVPPVGLMLFLLLCPALFSPHRGNTAIHLLSSVHPALPFVPAASFPLIQILQAKNTEPFVSFLFGVPGSSSYSEYSFLLRYVKPRLPFLHRVPV